MPKHPEITDFNFPAKEFAKLLDHSFLRAYFTTKDLDVFCDDVKNYGIKYVAVCSGCVADTVKRLQGTDVQIGAAIGFPIGKFAPEIKAAELELACQQGALFYDMVTDIGAIKEQDWDRARRDMETVQKVAKKYNVPGKAILETCFLTDEEMVKAAQIAVEAGMDYVKTSTGFAIGAFKNGVQTTNVHEIRLLKDTVGQDVGVKASTGCRSYENAIEYFKAGCTRVGTDKAPFLIQEWAKHHG